MIFLCQFSLLFIFLINSSPLNNDFLGVSMNNSLTLSSVFVSALFLRAPNKSFLNKFTVISYVSLSILLMFKLLTLLKGFCLLVFTQEGSRSLIFKDWFIERQWKFFRRNSRFFRSSNNLPYNSRHKFDIICPCETYLHSNNPLVNENLEISGYTLVCSDYPSNTKHRCVCLYHKNNLPLRVTNIGYLNECLTLECKVGDRIWNFVVLYRLPS